MAGRADWTSKSAMDEPGAGEGQSGDVRVAGWPGGDPLPGTNVVGGERRETTKCRVDPSPPRSQTLGRHTARAQPSVETKLRRDARVSTAGRPAGKGVNAFRALKKRQPKKGHFNRDLIKIRLLLDKING